MSSVRQSTGSTYKNFLDNLCETIRGTQMLISHSNAPWKTSFFNDYLSFSDVVENVVGKNRYHSYSDYLPIVTKNAVLNRLEEKINSDLCEIFGRGTFSLVSCSEHSTAMLFDNEIDAPLFTSDDWDAFPFVIGVTVFGDVHKWDVYDVYKGKRIEELDKELDEKKESNEN